MKVEFLRKYIISREDEEDEEDEENEENYEFLLDGKPYMYDKTNETGIRALHDYLAGNDIDIRCGDYADALKDLPALPASTFVYLDPPICRCRKQHLSPATRPTVSTIRNKYDYAMNA